MDVLDKGCVELVDQMGTDLSVVNAARVSMGKHKDQFDEIFDTALLQYLADNGHTSPFRCCQLTFHVKAPIFVLRQWMRHRIASEFNEISGRYVEFKDDDYYIPAEFRAAAIHIKQGSEGVIQQPYLAYREYVSAIKFAMGSYQELLNMGVCKEQARCVLPVAMYSEVYWTVSLEALANFLAQRMDGHAQWEIRQYANAIHDMALPLFPHSLPAILKAKQRIFAPSEG